MKKSAVVLLSGGLDSSTTLYYALSNGYKCFCLIFDYGQRHRKEIKSAQSIAELAGCEWVLVKVNLLWKGSALLDKNIKIPQRRIRGIPVTYVPARNTIFLGYATSYAEAINAKRIFIGANAVDFSGYPDCRPEFVLAFNHLISLGTKVGGQLKIEAPLIKKTKSQIVKMAIRLGVPLKQTWSCYRGGLRPCLRCDSCILRGKGFREAGVIDPLLSKR